MQIPGTDLECSRLGLGTWGLGGRNAVEGLELGWPELSRETAKAILVSARDSGISFFDCSDFYGNGAAETLLGEVFGADREVLFATKFGLTSRLQPGANNLARDFSGAAALKCIEQSLRRLRRDAIDLLQLHGPGIETLTHNDLWRDLDAARKAGKVRYVGVSVRTSEVVTGRLNEWCAAPLVSTVQAEYSAATPQCVRAIHDADLRGRGLLARSVFCHGMLLRDPYGQTAFSEQDHRANKWNGKMRVRIAKFWSEVRMATVETKLSTLLRFSLAGSNVAMAVVGASSPSQVTELVEAANRPPMGANERRVVEEAAALAFES